MSAESAVSDEVEELRGLVEAAHKRIDHLESELEAERSGPDTTFESDSAFDARDQAVLEALTVDQTVSVSRLKELYRTHTDIRAAKTLKNRIKTLTDNDAFEHVGPGAWYYRGEEQ